ncbi:hypothetical protein FH972_001428 [Carpinus fangiana]|uniref:C2H2-type domain-containing protein n=1 Tax=Carpinus fangiana TaxID=176857 RepID=A0A5N6QBN5_9ROSI|nr:hypothetical protein FH972_001428 [Carpinus fangiana]
MEEAPAPYWMWMKRKQILQVHSPPSMSTSHNNNSWEEKAFAEDSAGALGGCIWPPRSYSCNFCNREFRSAQALGGHMNVHRRDRARLKQSLSPINDQSSPTIVASAGDSSRVSALPNIPENLTENHDHTFASAYSSSVAPSCSETVGVRLLRISESEPQVLLEKSTTPRAYHQDHSICLGYDDYVETDLSVGMNNPFVSSKRPKTAVSSLSFFLKACSDDNAYHLQTTEDLDLELRLGDPPKVK